MSAEVATVLRAARSLIATPETWTRDAPARDEKGNSQSDYEKANRSSSLGVIAILRYALAALDAADGKEGG